jgi:putative phosphoserine phosphatase/1-acylglycerol-3-phosphate O-acyltransferase
MRRSGPPSLPIPRVAALFDMDKTLIAENSGSLYLQYLHARGEIGDRDLLAGLGDYLRYKIGSLDLGRFAETMAAPFAGRTEKSVAAETREWFEERVVAMIYPEAEAHVHRHRARGDIVAIVSGAPQFAIEPLAEYLGIEHVICTRFLVEAGRYTGGVEQPVCFGEGKIERLRQFLESFEIDLARSWFYTDSVTDLPLLEEVGHPVVTNPDPMLYWTASRRHWPVEFFEPPAVVS